MHIINTNESNTNSEINMRGKEKVPIPEENLKKSKPNPHHGTILNAFILSTHELNEFRVFRNPKNPCSLLLFILSKCSTSTPSTTSANHQFPTCPSFVSASVFYGFQIPKFQTSTPMKSITPMRERERSLD